MVRSRVLRAIRSTRALNALCSVRSCLRLMVTFVHLTLIRTDRRGSLMLPSSVIFRGLSRLSRILRNLWIVVVSLVSLRMDALLRLLTASRLASSPLMRLWRKKWVSRLARVKECRLGRSRQVLSVALLMILPSLYRR